MNAAQRERRIRLNSALLACSLLLSGQLQAADALARARLAGGENRLWVGQQVTVVVELLAPGFFASAASFDLPDPEGVLLIPPTSHPVLDTETIDGIEYTVQRHEITAWPMRPGVQSVPALTVRFSFKRHPLDKAGVAASVTTEAIPFTVGTPPGAEQLGSVISARGLQVTERWQPDPADGDVPAGSAFTRTITFTAPGVPGMIFPPFPPAAIDGLGVYAKQALFDRANRGDLTGERRETITYVCQRSGQFTVPAATFTWFDLDAGRLRTETFAARTLNVVPNPHLPTERNAWHWQSAAPMVSLAGISILLVALAASARARRLVRDAIAPFRAIHLQPLNPTERSGRGGP